MRKIRFVVALGACAVGIVFAAALQAYPAPGPGQQTYITYYSNSSFTKEVGGRDISHAGNCTMWRTSWGTTRAYSKLRVVNCDPLAAPSPPKPPRAP